MSMVTRPLVKMAPPWVYLLLVPVVEQPEMAAPFMVKVMA